MAQKLLLFLIFIIGYAGLFSQDSIKSIHAIRVTNPPKIDGVLNDDVWKNVPVAKEFVQYWPDNGAPAWQKSEVKFIYDNAAFYIGAMLYDTSPDSILTGLSERDNINNSDLMGVYLDLQGNGLNGYGFYVTTSGIQIDVKVDQYNEDLSYDAVWLSETSITDSGWIAEIKIPYTAIRFPNTEIQNWKINIWRTIARYGQHVNWNYIDSEKDGLLPQSGKLLGIKNIKPPLRLSLTPYISAYFEKNPENEAVGTKLNGGMDLKYGLNESFTLDMTLIPDFSQVQSDDKILNLSPYETFYSEKRPFFNEGTELFNKLGMFHSRRIGDEPVRHDDVKDNLNDKDSIIFNQSETKMINATKLSGRTKDGLGIGLFNAMTGEAKAIVADSNGIEKKIITQPFTNYNMIVLDQDLKNNSYINLSNTNYYRPNDGYKTNVTGSEFVLKNKTKKYKFQARGILSQQYNDTAKSIFGHSYYINAGKISGKYQGNVSFLALSNKYNINEMGYMRKNNITETNIFIQYEINKPFWILNSFHTHFDIYGRGINNPFEYTALVIYHNFRITTKELHRAALNSSVFPFGEKDYNETRVEGRYFKGFKKQYHIGGWIETDSRKKVSIFFNPGTRWWDNPGNFRYWLFSSVNYRISNKLSFFYEFGLTEVFNQYGWVETNEDDENIIYFGKRYTKVQYNTFSTKFILNKSSYFTLRMRHYNSIVDYEDQFYELENNGRLKNSTYDENHDESYNIFNIDMKYAWRFAPGSELTIVWKNVIEREDDIIYPNYFDNLDKTFNYEQTNSISLKLIYYLDYLYLVRKNK